ncbi:sensor histidine kinase [Luteibacter sahnii]|uniref:sensor histidine kinase n=1 Tax=Luteibacter sahnii TaxID=3021977 RepID=UPI002A6AC450|nr:HAMP domain-containing sensor histidine kinase [Luteibacter sp. PPL193]MDY1547568.1 HAMP domain-containing sensor histidine kinase [Luteibacter sp. PPL193]
MSLTDFRHSMVFRMAAGYVALLLLSVTLIAGVFYVGTAGLLRKNIDEQLRSRERQLVQEQRQHGMGGLVASIHELLTDDQDSDTEIYLLLDAAGHRIIGNLTTWPAQAVATDGFHQGELERLQRPASALLLTHRFTGGETLVVGRDVQDVRMLEHRIMMAFVVGGLLAVLLSAGGALLFRSQLQRQLKAIHRTTTEVAAGRLGQRIAIGRSRDEFAIVAHDVNTMLDEIERLMDNARQVSNAIAHDLRTPLGRIRVRLEQALRSPERDVRLPDDAQRAIDDVDGLISVLGKMLHIAEAESGVRRRSFERLSIVGLFDDMIDLYQPAAEQQAMALRAEVQGTPEAMGDRQLLAGVLANLLDNALKYAGEGANITLRAVAAGDWVRLSVRDDGPGVPEAVLARATERFFRADASRHQKGNGLGLSIVAAVVSMHRGRLTLENGHPGLCVTIELPSPDLSIL